MFYILLIVVNTILYVIINGLFLSHEKQKLKKFHAEYASHKDELLL